MKFRIRCSAIGSIMGYWDKPKMPKGAETYVKTWLKEKLYKRRKEINTKYMDKGNICEDQSISFVNKVLCTNYKKNEVYKEDDWMTGTADIVDKKIIDMKNSYDFSTFPLFDDEIKNAAYDWQLTGYMSLWDKQSAEVIYTLMDLPDYLIEREAKSMAYKKNCEIEDVIDEVRAFHTYSDIPNELRYKRQLTERDDVKIQAIKDRVELCQTYVNQLLEGMK